VRLSISLTDFSWPGGEEALVRELGRVASAAEDAGLHTLWVADHLLQAAPGSAPDSPMLEAYTTLGYLAARTQRIRLGTMVTAATYRPAALLVKAVTTLDVLSGGRAWLGIGAGYHEEEARALGLPLPPMRERFDRLEDTLEIALRMWAGDASPFTGRHSVGVARIATGVGETVGLDGERLRDLRRAALLHDLGKLGVSNLILDKPGKLDDAEWAAIRRHPELTERILVRVPPFEHFAVDAGAHHERLDGRGYFRGLTGEQLGWMPRILAVADVFEALTADRPYRSGLDTDEALGIMRRDTGAFCPEHFAALESWVGAGARTVSSVPA